MNRLSCFFILFAFASAAQISRPVRIDSIPAFFENGKWQVQNSDAVVKLIKKYERSTEVSIQLIAYTDTVGTADYNKALADLRLKSAEKLLSASAITATEKVSFGELESAAGLSSSRRVDILVYIREEQQQIVASQPELREVELNKISILAIEFENGTDNLRDYSYKEIDKVFFVLLDHPDYNIELHGHVCCGPGTPLSLARAIRVKTILIRKGISGDRIETFGHGNTQPLNADKTEAEQKVNRRVEVLYKKGDSEVEIEEE